MRSIKKADLETTENPLVKDFQNGRMGDVVPEDGSCLSIYITLISH